MPSDNRANERAESRTDKHAELDERGTNVSLINRLENEMNNKPATVSNPNTATKPEIDPNSKGPQSYSLPELTIVNNNGTSANPHEGVESSGNSKIGNYNYHGKQY